VRLLAFYLIPLFILSSCTKSISRTLSTPSHILTTTSKVTASTPDGGYEVGEVVAIQVVFSKEVFVTGIPKLTLETGTTDAVVPYISGNATNTLLFNYKVEKGHRSLHLDYKGPDSLALDGGTIRNSDGKDVELTLPPSGSPGSLSTNKKIALSPYTILENPEVPLTYTHLGKSLSAVGDLNGDGKSDFIAGMMNFEAGGVSRGKAVVYSATGEVIYSILGLEDNATLGRSVAGAGDINGDGKPDFLIGEPYASAGGISRGKAYVYSGATGKALFPALVGTEDRALFGWSLAGIGDVNSDGKSDFVIGEPGAAAGGTARGKVHVYSGATGTLLYVIDGNINKGKLGFSVAGIGDVNSDGKPDILVGLPGTDPSTVIGYARVYSGADGSFVYGFATGAGGYGTSVAGAGDIDGDGTSDFIIGSPYSNGYKGTVHVISGATGSEIHAILGTDPGGTLGESVAGPGDVDGDGKADILAGAPLAEISGIASGKVSLFSGESGGVLWSHVPDMVGGGDFGACVAAAGDLNGDGKPDYLIGQAVPKMSDDDRSRLYMFFSRLK
jgi:hypothetical protein